MNKISSYLDSHFNENFTIHEVGMKLTPEQDSLIRSKLRSLESKAPAFTTTNLKFYNLNHETWGELLISGTGKNFHSVVHGQNPLEIYEKLESEISQQLKQWKKTRFKEKFLDFPMHLNQVQIPGGYAS